MSEAWLHFAKNGDPNHSGLPKWKAFDKSEPTMILDNRCELKNLMGFGHREYKKGDSRAFYMSKVAKELGIEKANTKYGEIADVLEKTMLDRKNLFPNVDFPVPVGPASMTASPAGMPPPMSASSPGTPVDSRVSPRGCASRRFNCCSGMRGNICSPSSVMRNVCRPGICGWPRTFTA